ncbi:C-terminal processing protease CtpA/Prc [Pontibacter ummariensis]|uniref:C-terminal processing protease CtpA/Prc, contains a PDZ domain n=1 Tax=Pontibacter ummariensis TaxID=1610492 RepID=A0A239HMG9_9BACT|nr:S41 family peptidase [Pontibacter ummariensis]PRY10335.1 C-terminal processing protease CtpA/Prc [Pontibacter ummariensis]SNS82512.1 C-terminal processing protease CtpA/Prc, contains a PDZ domain [Pontibacter ummariensis]
MKKYLFALLLLVTFSVKAQVPNTLSPADKVYGLSKFWQEVNYNFVYLDKVDRVKWENDYREAIIKVQNTKNDYEYYRELQKLCATLKDGHTNIYMPKSVDSLVYNDMFGKYRIYLSNIDNKAIITRTNLSIKDEVPVGSEIVEVNGLPTAEYLQQNVLPYLASSTDYVLMDLAVKDMLKGPKGEQYTIKYKTPKGKVRSLTLTHAKTTEQEVYPALEKRELLELKWYPNQTAYLALNGFHDPKINELFLEKLPELRKAKALIIDLRYNGGGSTTIGREILSYLSPDTLLYGSKNSTRQHLASYKAWGVFTQPKDTVGDEWATKSLMAYQDKLMHEFDYSPAQNKVEASEKLMIVPTAILIGHRTASAAEDFLIYADNQRHMIKIGENSFGSTGQPFMFEMPGGGVARICTKKDTYPDGREFVGYGVKPDIEVKMTLQDYIGKKDPVLERALMQLKGQKRHLTSKSNF